MIPKKKLTEYQKGVVDHEGDLLVDSNAGSGKSTTTVHKAKEIIDRGESVQLLAFNKDASLDLKDDIKDLFGKEVDDIDGLRINTINSFGNWITRWNQDRLGLDLDNDSLISVEWVENRRFQYNIVEEAIGEISFDRVDYDEGKVRECLNETHEPKSDGYPQQRGFLKPITNMVEMMMKTQDRDLSNLLIDAQYPDKFNDVFSFFKEDYFIDAVYNKYIEYARENDMMTFTLQEYFLRESAAMNRFNAPNMDYLIVDEAQDMNYLVYEGLKDVVKKRNANLVMVGDVAQCIYSFNGSSPEILGEKFEEEFDADVIGLSKNFRCPEEVVAIGNKFRKRLDMVDLWVIEADREPKDNGFPKVQDTRKLDDTNDSVEEMLSDGRDLEDIRIVARSRNKLSEVENSLAKNKIEYTNISANSDLLNKKEVKYLMNRLRVVEADNDRELIGTWERVAGSMENMGEKRFHNLVDAYRSNRNDYKNFNRFLGKHQLEDIPNIGPKTVESIMNEMDLIKAMFKSMEDGYNPVSEMIETPKFQNYVDEISDDDTIAEERVSNARNFATRYERHGNLEDVEDELEDTTDDPDEATGVVLSTIHKTKGKEFNSVIYVTDMNLSYGLEEELRAAYVAITRTKENLIIQAETPNRFTMYANDVLEDTSRYLP